MASGYFMDMNGISSPYDYTIRAVAQFGDNDDSWGGDNELLLGGQSWASYVGGQMTWNPATNADGSWISGWVPVQLTVAAGGGTGGVTFSVADGSPETLVDSSESYGTISAVEVRAGAQAQGTVQWGNVQVEFGTASGVDDVYTATVGPAVNTTGDDPNDATAEQDLVVRPSAANQTTVTVAGNVRLTSPNGPNMNPSDLFGDVLIFAGARAA